MKPGFRKIFIALACTFLALNAAVGAGYTSQGPTNPIFLPFITYSQGAGPGHNPGNDFINAGFEDGLAGWEFVSGRGGSDIPSTEQQHTGLYSAKLGGEHYWGASVAQTVTVPSDRPVLVYWTWISSQELECEGAYDFYTVSVNGGVVFEQGLCEAISTQGWEQRTLDLSAFAGQDVYLKIRFESDSVLLSDFFIDDLAFDFSQ
jgi:hypothetical protein